MIELPEKPKKELLPPTSSFKFLLSLLPKKEVGEIVRQIEEALASDVRWLNERHYFLENSEKHAFDAARNRLEAGKFKISREKMKEIVRVGLVQAYQDGTVTAGEIGRFIDDVASLWLFTNTLVDMESESEVSPIWAHTFDIPPDMLEKAFPGTEIEDIM